ncbi:L-carnitine dehydratase/bile acid-inducible protein F [Paraglaciecola sp. T6c]|uniref:CaiB/BaiF CoA transferase family protein n=1 Tax=Pseudoalteromonas atlantica (strain T6c / ATCC BAA-1087) TaxID=3042615 RepID=UPI00005C607C|nr:CaiB/BaiF CoA-transferase family protein [Paraglaciecola sp. T6c]ABG41274.1 L-carnitine dehydratase/bile acid-inducible protein F [Paraglaciecola sp. T6c]
MTNSVMPNAGRLPLTGIKVVEFTHMVMGPTAGVILADLGAEVIKIEPLTGDNTRRLKGSGAGYFSMYNRNKQSVCIDIKSPEGKDVALSLLEEADILLENFRPGAMDKLGLGYEQLKTINPRLIYCSLKGFLSGPYAHRTALDEVTQMMGGLAYMTGLPDKPMRAGSSVIDITGGMFGVIGILAALEERHHTHEGKNVTCSLYETTAFMVGQHMAQQAVTGEAPPPMSVRRSAWAIYDIFHCANDEQVFIGVVSDTQWRIFCDAFGLQEFALDQTLALNNGRVAQRERILPVINAVFATLSKAELMAKLEKSGLPFAPINKPSDLFDDPHLNAGGLVDVTLPDGVRTKLPGLPLEMNNERMPLRHDIPTDKGNSVATLKDAGFSDEDIKKLLALGVVRA